MTSKFAKYVKVTELDLSKSEKSQEEKDILEKLEKGYPLPKFLEPYSRVNMKPNDTFTIWYGREKTAKPIHVKLFGLNKDGVAFTRKDLYDLGKKEKVIVNCNHDAPHSVVLFLKNKDRADFAFFNKVGFNYAFVEEYVKYYTQTYNFPLVITEYGIPLKETMEKNGVHKQGKMGRWCSRVYKGETPRNLYKTFNLNVVQLLGISQFQSPKRQKMYQGKSLSPYSQKGFEIHQEMPIHNLVKEPEQEQIIEFKDFKGKFGDLSKGEKVEYLKKYEIQEHERIMGEHNIKVFPIIRKLGSHGCIVCPFRNNGYYKNLSEKEPILYEFSRLVQKWGSYRKIKKIPNYVESDLYWYGWNKVNDRRMKLMASLKKINKVKWEENNEISAPTRVKVEKISITKNGIEFLNLKGNLIIPALSKMKKPDDVYL